MRTCGAFLIIVLSCSACSSNVEIDVSPVAASVGLKQVCIDKNPAVDVDDFFDVVRAGFQRHGIDAKIGSGSACENVVSYTARRHWDMSVFLSYAELRVQHDGAQVGYFVYNIPGGRGLNLSKYDSTSEKIDPLMDQMLAAYK